MIIKTKRGYRKVVKEGINTPRIDRGGPRAAYCRKRIISPRVCDNQSFRIKTIKPGVKITVCCPKGYFDRESGRCRVGTIRQSVLKKKLRSGACPRF